MRSVRRFAGPSLPELHKKFRYMNRPKTVVEKCPVCQNPKQFPVQPLDRYGFPQPSVLCEQCGLVYLTPILTREGYAELYDHYYRPLVSAFWRQPWGPDRVLRDSKRYATDLAVYLRRYLPRTAETIRILDVGGSTGAVASIIADLCRTEGFSTDVTVIDPSAAELAYPARSGFRTRCGFVEDIDLQGAKYDLILLCESIEHLMKPKDTLARIREHLAKNGVFYADYVPANILMPHRSVRRTLQLDHICYFSAGVFYPMMADLGFLKIGEEFVRKDERGNVFVAAEKQPASYSPEHAAQIREMIERTRG